MNALEHRIRELRRRYAQTLPDRLASIASILMPRGELRIVRADLLRQFHTVAGTAGTFGYEDIATLAADAECLLSSASAPNVSPEEVQLLAVRLVDLDAAVRRHLDAARSHDGAWSTFEGGGVV